MSLAEPAKISYSVKVLLLFTASVESGGRGKEEGINWKKEMVFGQIIYLGVDERWK